MVVVGVEVGHHCCHLACREGRRVQREVLVGVHVVDVVPLHVVGHARRPHLLALAKPARMPCSVPLIW